jgi:hypothetical protein
VPVDVNVSQQSREKKPSKWVVRTWVDRSEWDRQLFSNPHALTIYLEFVPAQRTMLERFEKCQCEDDDVCLHCRTWVPDDGHYRWLRGPINPLSMEHRVEYVARHSSHSRFFCNCDLSSLNQLLSCNSPEATQVKMLILKFSFDYIEESHRSGN